MRIVFIISQHHVGRAAAPGRRDGYFGGRVNAEAGRCAEGTQERRSAWKTFANAGFPPNYPILGIGVGGNHCLCFKRAELPRSKRILEATGYRYPVAFSIGARQV